MCFEFIQNNKQDRIRRKAAVKSEKNGGLGIPDLSEYSSALKIMWIRTKQTKHKLKNITSVIYPILKKIHHCGLRLH